MKGRGVLFLGAGLALAGLLALSAAYLISPASANSFWSNWTGTSGNGQAYGPGPGPGPGMMGGYGRGSAMMGGYGMMAGYGNWAAPSSAPGPGQAGFVAGTTSAPRVVRVFALPDDRFTPDTVTVQTGETITFEVTAMGPTTHEFMVGPAADVASDKHGTPEIAAIGTMQTRSITYTFSGSGPFAFACHAPGHYESGMKGTIVVQ